MWVPVSGSGMRATEVKHTPLKVDLTDPDTVPMHGDPNGGEWMNHDANPPSSSRQTPFVGNDLYTPEFPFDAPSAG